MKAPTPYATRHLDCRYRGAEQQREKLERQRAEVRDDDSVRISISHLFTITIRTWRSQKLQPFVLSFIMI